MSTEDKNRAVVTLERGVDTEQFVSQMLDAGYELHDEKPGSKRNFDFVMTREQAAELRQDPRIVDVRYGSKIENGFNLVKATLDPARAYSKVSGEDNTHYNWAHRSCTTDADPFSGVAGTINEQFGYTLTGKGVDVVIQDSGIDPTHPEWLAQDGSTNRLQSIDWPSAAGLSGTYTQPTNHNRDIDGHGTHVAGTAAGRLYGWAKEANLYSIKILDDPGETYGISASFNLIRAWHNAKTNGRPTIVNMSWGYFAAYQNINGGNYRGSSWNGTNMEAAYGMIQGQQNSNSDWTFPVRVASVDADIQDCIDDGIILVGAAGNGSHKIDVPGGVDYDNYFVDTSFGNSYYHRGSTPSSVPGVICVGNISYVYESGQEPLFNSSEKGPRVDISAPGGIIPSAAPAGIGPGTPYPLDSNFEIQKQSGTSMASPQVAGVVATVLEARPTYTPEQCLRWLQEVGEEDRLYDPTTGTPGTDYSNLRALQGAANLYLKTPFRNPTPYSAS